MNWETVADLSAADDAWAARDRAQWDPFRLSLVSDLAAEPTISAVGALTRAVGALPSATTQPTEQESFDARTQLLLVERRVEYLGANTGAQLDELRAADQRDELLQTVSALPLTEQMVYRYNGDDGGAAPDTPLVAWYPSDGAPDTDYPFVELDVPWADEQTRDAAQALLEALQSDEGIERLHAAGFRDRSRDATAELIAADGLRPEMAGPEADAVPTVVLAPVLSAWRGLSQTGNLLAVMDVSGSMKTLVPGTNASRLELSAGGLAAGIALLDPATSAGVWEFSTDLEGGADHRELVAIGPLDGSVGGVSRQEAAVAAARSLQPRDDTGLYDTIVASYEHMLDRYVPGSLNAVILFTDGRNDDADGISLSQMQARLRELVDPQRPVLFVGVGYGPEADFDALDAVTSVTGGKLYSLERPEDIRDVFVDVQTGNVG